MTTTEIVRAIKQGPHRLTKTVKALQKKGRVVDNTALYDVLEANDFAAVDGIISCPLFANIGDRNEKYGDETPLSYVMNLMEKTPRGMDYCVVASRLILSEKFDVNERDRHGRTALHVAAKLGLDPMMDLLLFADTDVNARVAFTKDDIGDCGMTALELALRTGRESTINRLLRDVTVTLSFYFGEKESNVKLILRAIETDVQDVFVNAVRNETVETVRLLVDDHRVDVNATLFDSRHRVLNNEISLLQLAATQGYEDICKILLRHPGLDINARATENETVLHQAARENRYGVVRILLEHSRTDVNALDEFGSTPLMEAVRWDSVLVTDILLQDERVDVNAACGEGMTALQYAMEKKHLSAITFLFVSFPRVDVNVVDRLGRSLAFRAAERNDERLLKKLYKHPKMNKDTTDSAEKKLLDMLRMLKRVATRGECDFCGTGDDLKKCGGCGCARYYCELHQNLDYERQHRHVCHVLRE